ncbi:MAG: hypothetical protein IPJ39_02610 [Saprospiraceae bacterium]|nr:hypothetical protein [Saprospiraceae bacterium]
MIFNKFTYIILSITIILAACKQTPKIDPIKDITETYGTGEVSRKYQRIDGKIEGKMTDYYPTGEIKGVRIFKNDNKMARPLYTTKMAASKKCNTI